MLRKIRKFLKEQRERDCAIRLQEMRFAQLRIDLESENYISSAISNIADKIFNSIKREKNVRQKIKQDFS